MPQRAAGAPEGSHPKDEGPEGTGIKTIEDWLITIIMYLFTKERSRERGHSRREQGYYEICIEYFL